MKLGLHPELERAVGLVGGHASQQADVGGIVQALAASSKIAASVLRGTLRGL